MTEPTIEISTKKLALLVRPVIPIANKDRMIPLLRAVRLQSSGAYLVASATDRFRIGISRVILDPAPPKDFDILLGIDELRQILSVFKSGSTVEKHVTITVLDGKIRVEQAMGFGFIDASMSFPLVQGDFPKLGHLFDIEPGVEPVAITGFNASYLADFQYATQDGEPLVVRSAAATKPTIVSAGDHFVGAIMPVRINDVMTSLDSWKEFLAAPKNARKSPAKSKADAA